MSAFRLEGRAAAFGVVLLFAAIFVALFAPALLSTQLLGPGDGYRSFLPAYYGPKTLWVGDVLGGFPRVADPEMMTFYVPLLLLSAIPGSWNAFVILAYVMAGSFCAAWVRSLTGSWLAGILGGLVYAMGGFMIAHLGHVSMIHSAAWTPLVLLALEKQARNGSLGWWTVAVLATAGCVLGGHPQVAAYSLALAVLSLLGAPDGPRRWHRRGSGVAALALGLGLSGVQLLPTLGLLPGTIRADVDLRFVAAHSFPPAHYVTLILPFARGGFGGPFGGYSGTSLVEISGYVGLLPLALAAVALAWRRAERAVALWAGVGVTVLVLILGPVVAPLEPLYSMPPLSLFRAPARALFALALATSVLAGFGVVTLERGSREVRAAGLRLALTTLAGLLLLGLALAVTVGRPFVEPFDDSPWEAWVRPGIVRPLLWSGLAGAGLALWASRPGRWTRTVFVGVACLELASFARHADWRYQAPNRSQVEPSRLVQRVGGEAVARNVRVMLGDRGGWASTSNLGMVWGIPTVDGFTSLVRENARGALTRWLSEGNRSLDVLAGRYVVWNRDRARVVVAGGRFPPHRTQRLGIHVRDDDLGIRIGPPHCPQGPPPAAAIVVPGFAATRLAVVSNLWGAEEIVHGTTVLELHGETLEGDVLVTSLRAGVDTGEYAWGRADVRPIVAHRRPPVFGATPMPEGYAIYRYLGVAELPRRATLTRLRAVWRLPAEDCRPGAHLIQITLIDERAKPGHDLQLSLPSLMVEGHDRWRPFGSQGPEFAFENTKALPRAWLVYDVRQEADAIAAVRRGRLPDGTRFDPARTALVAGPVPGPWEPAGSWRGHVSVVSLSDGELELRTNADRRSFLVVSERWHPGWRAAIDREEVPVQRVDGLVMGLPVPPGRHAIRLWFAPPSAAAGALLSGVSGLVLVGMILARARRAAGIPSARETEHEA